VSCGLSTLYNTCSTYDRRHKTIEAVKFELSICQLIIMVNCRITTEQFETFCPVNKFVVTFSIIFLVSQSGQWLVPDMARVYVLTVRFK
jgi:hypothetical protein